MQELTEPAGIAAIAAAALAAAALVLGLVTALRLRRIRSAQSLVLGEHGETDLVAHAAALEQAFGALDDEVHAVSDKLERRMGDAERRLDGAIAFRSLVRYDAYGEMSGRQSMSIALLDAERSGVVLTSIHHRDQARFYAKAVHAGEGELELSPEEADAVRIALAGGTEQAS